MFVVSSCTYKAGCQIKSLHVVGDQRTICTHAMTHLVSLSLFLFDCLAEHLLVELRARLGSDKQLEAQLRREDIYLLMTACGKRNRNLLKNDGNVSRSTIVFWNSPLGRIYRRIYIEVM